MLYHNLIFIFDIFDIHPIMLIILKYSLCIYIYSNWGKIPTWRIRGADRDCFEDSSRFMRFVTKAQSRARQDEEADRETSVRRLFCAWQPRATYARELVHSLARLIIQLISPRRSPTRSRELRGLRVLHIPNKLRRIFSEYNLWYLRERSTMTLLVQQEFSTWSGRAVN